MKADSDQAAIRQIPLRMIDAWNRGSGEAFAAPFSEHADFIAFEGTHLVGRAQIAAFHQRAFDTLVKGSRLEGAVKSVRLLNPELAIMHAVASTALAGQSRTSPSRDSMQLFVVAKHDGAWQVEAVLNARRLTLEQQAFADDVAALPEPARREIIERAAGLRSENRETALRKSL